MTTPHEDRVLHVAFRHPHDPAPLTAAERRVAAEMIRTSRAAVEQVRRERAEAHRRLWTSLDRLKEQQP